MARRKKIPHAERYISRDEILNTVISSGYSVMGNNEKSHEFRLHKCGKQRHHYFYIKMESNVVHSMVIFPYMISELRPLLNLFQQVHLTQGEGSTSYSKFPSSSATSKSNFGYSVVFESSADVAPFLSELAKWVSEHKISDRRDPDCNNETIFLL